MVLLRANHFLHHRLAPKAVPLSTDPYFTPLTLASLYLFPNGTGTGQTVGIIELGGGYLRSDLTAYLTYLSMTSYTPRVTAVLVDGARNNPRDTESSIEVTLDIEIVMAVAPEASIRVYFAPNSFSGFYHAIQRAYTDGCTLVSISWGAPENAWPPSTMNNYNALFATMAAAGVTVFAAAGDNGSSDGVAGAIPYADFPASSPNVVACGGTTLTTTGGQTVISNEVVWNASGYATGGGYSTNFTPPAYQTALSLPGRGLPDVSACGDPNTGYIIYLSGSLWVVGGTSCVSPLMAGLFARVNQRNGFANGLGLVQPLFYATPSCCRDITSGNNNTTTTPDLYNASVGWDAASGLGVPVGTSVLALSPLPLTVTFTVSPPSGTVPFSVQFTNTTTSATAITAFLWNFGDGSTSTSTSPCTHIFAVAGTYTVSLTLTNATGTYTTSRVDVVVAANPILTAAFTWTRIAPRKIKFKNTTVDVGNAGKKVGTWNFGNGSVRRYARLPIFHLHKYRRTAAYTVSLIVQHGSKTSTVSHVVNVT